MLAGRAFLVSEAVDATEHIIIIVVERFLNTLSAFTSFFPEVLACISRDRSKESELFIDSEVWSPYLVAGLELCLQVSR